MCACGIGEVARANHPYLHSIQMSADQNRWVLAEYIGKRLAGGNAVHSPDYAGQPRRFAYLYADVGEQANTFAEDFAAVLTQEWDVELAQLVPYVFDPNSLQEQAANIIASLKADGITSIVFVGPPTAPRQFTTAATEQDYFPEWILSGALLVDTNVFARTYDQTQWANAFGLSITAVPIDRSAGGPSYLYNWFHGDVAPRRRQRRSDVDAGHNLRRHSGGRARSHPPELHGRTCGVGIAESQHADDGACLVGQRGWDLARPSASRRRRIRRHG